MSKLTSGYSAREIPFYGLPSSKVVSDAPTAHDAMVLADLDWSVHLSPAFQSLSDGYMRVVPDRFLTVRSDTEKVLGTVGKVYRPLQNVDSFDFADGLLDFGAKFDAAGSYNNDRNIFLTAKLPEGITIEGTDDALDLYLLFTNSHDGSGAIRAMVTPIRLSCTNMLALALRSAVSTWTARHTLSAPEKMDEAIRTLNIVSEYRSAFEATAALLLDTEVNLEGFTKLAEEISPAKRLQEGMRQTWLTSPTVDRNTGYGALNAVSEFYEHERGGKGNTESRFDSLVSGQSAIARNRALQLLTNR